MTLPTPTATCDTCRFWSQQGDMRTKDEDPVLLGQCRRYAPAVLVVDADYKLTTRFPLTRADEWCGDRQQHPLA